MQLRTSGGDGFRISVSSTPSCSSGGSGPDDIESLGDVYIWGEVWSDVAPDGSLKHVAIKNDVLSPKPLESNVVLDVQQIACGMRHLALVTRQGEVFTWGEESGGRLGHGIEKDFSSPKLVEFLAVTNVDFVACGEYHSCAVSTVGDLYTWGDGTHNAGILGQGTDVSHWIPKRVSGPLEGLQVISIACGAWHSALTTSNGKLFTFGDGSFGVLGHGDRESLSFPKEVQLLSGLKTIKVACGVWHTAAIVEVMGQAGATVSSRKLFTWGDGDKYRLGHGSKDTYLLPTCISSLIDYNFHQIACGHTMTVALTTSGHVFAMGSTAYGQLGNPSSDGKNPSLVQDNLVGEFVEEVSCGAYHVAVLTSRSEMYTWGKGANGRLGHGDTDDRGTPTLVETFRDRIVKNISCGSNFTSSICIHKWVSGADQSVCSGCRQAFGFTRKRHNCYNCGLVHCHACSSKKALKAALAPTPGKPHRVCDACYAKLKASEAGTHNINRKITTPRSSVESRERRERGEVRGSRILLLPTTEPIKYLEIRSAKHGTKYEGPSIVRASQVPSLLQLKDIAFPSSLSALQSAWKPTSMSQPGFSNLRPASPYSRRPSPPRASTAGFSRSVIDSLKKTNEIMKQDMSKMQNQIKSFKQKCDSQGTEIQKLQKQAKETALFATAEASKSKAARELVKSITEQLKDIRAQLPPDVQESETFKAMNVQIETFLATNETPRISSLAESLISSQQHASKTHMHDQADGTGLNDLSRSSVSSNLEVIPQHSSNQESSSMRKEGESIEQFEPGVYVTFIQRSDGAKIFKRVKFSKRRFQAQQAEEWWKENKDRLLRRYSPQAAANAAPAGSSSSPAESPSARAASPSAPVASPRAPVEPSSTAAEEATEAAPSET
ncbi:PH, RCC1 and FYVE domains-containing protein 1 isoform X2 [Jatropha curcas]|nr:PH, RCC1 and FYVE domains-containing protein 1 isoform X2 [Jatropha curcas]